MNETISDFLDVKEAAHVLRVKVPTLRLWLRNGQMPYFQPSKKKLIRRDDLKKFIEKSAR